MIVVLTTLVLQLQLLAFMQVPVWQASDLPPSDEVQAEVQLKRAELIEAAVHELEIKGWTDIEIIRGEADSSRWGGLVIDTIDIEDGVDLYTVLGKTAGMHHNPITAAVEITFDHETFEWKRQRVYYVSEAGRYMGADDLMPDEILAADDQILWSYLYSY